MWLLVAAACSSGGGDAPAEVASGPAAFRTVAYVHNECRDDPDGQTFSIRQEVRVLRDDGSADGTTVVVDGFAWEGLPARPLPPPLDACREPGAAPGTPWSGSACLLYGLARDGGNSVILGVYQRLAVTPDGEAVVFEKTDDFSAFGNDRFLAPEEEGIFYVRADGTGLRRLGPASREPSFTAGASVTTEQVECDIASYDSFGISPNGRHLAFTDRGPAPSGADATQVVVVDLDSGERRTLTRLEPLEPDPTRALPAPPVVSFGFLDDESVLYRLRTAGLGPVTYIGRLDGSEPREISVLRTDFDGGSDAGFHITGGLSGAQTFRLEVEPGSAEYDPSPAKNMIVELFWFEGEGEDSRYVQLTNFRRSDTRSGVVSADGELVFFHASTDRLGENPQRSCQLFSIDRTGSGLRQLTHGPEPLEGCRLFPGSCDFFILGQDVASQSIVFVSTCNLSTAGADLGEWVFAMRPDGSGLRRLTPLRGLVIGETTTVELPGPVAFSRTGTIGRIGR